MKSSSFALVAALVAATSSDALAFERQHHLGVDGGLGMLSINQKGTLSVGGGGGVHYAYGLTDAFNLMAEGSFMQVALEEQGGKGIPNNRPTSVTNLGVGVGYVLDVLRWVPYAGLLAEGYWMNGGTIDTTTVAAGAAIALGLDYSVTRAFAVGFAFRQHFALSKITDYPSYSQFLLRAELTWGY